MKSFCSYYNENTCNSCDLITLDYSDQISYKENLLKNSLKLESSSIFLNTVLSPTLNFRNKVKLTVTGSLENPIIGILGKSELDKGRELLNCQIHLPSINQLLPGIKQFIKLAKLTPYNIQEKKGELKGIIIFQASQGEETYLRFILRSKESIDRIKNCLKFLTINYPDLACISANIQPVAHAILEGQEEIYMTEKKAVIQKIKDLSLSLGPQAFVQTNQIVAQKLYATAAQWVKESSSKRFMELFCGQGAFSFFCAPYIETALGIEINPAAVEEANLTAKKLNFSHLKFKHADAAKIDEEMLVFKPEIILVNPPRRGLTNTLDLILNHKPNTIIYSSCNYETLVNDIQNLNSSYKIQRLQIFDMFPHTSHFETLVELKILI